MPCFRLSLGVIKHTTRRYTQKSSWDIEDMPVGCNCKNLWSTTQELSYWLNCTKKFFVPPCNLQLEFVDQKITYLLFPKSLRISFKHISTHRLLSDFLNVWRHTANWTWLRDSLRLFNAWGLLLRKFIREAPCRLFLGLITYFRWNNTWRLLTHFLNA